MLRLIIIVLVSQATTSCDLFVTQSIIKDAGRGLIAGRNFLTGDVVLDVPTLFIPSDHRLGLHVENYVFESGIEGYDMIALGYASLLNHAEDPNVEHYWNKDPVTLQDATYSHHIPMNISVQFVAIRDISIGEEILTSYGGNEWFTSRFGDDFILNSNYYLTKSFANDSLDLISPGKCISDVYIEKSTFPLAGAGLFANKSFSSGDIVSISPALVIPTDAWTYRVDDSVFINYCLWQPGSKIGLLLLGHAAMVNHQNSFDANVIIEWCTNFDDIDFGFQSSSGSSTITEATTTPTAARSQSCQPRSTLEHTYVGNLDINRLLSSAFTNVDVALIAVSDIKVGDEITVNYGEEWLSEWANFLSMSFLHCQECSHTTTELLLTQGVMNGGEWVGNNQKRFVDGEKGQQQQHQQQQQQGRGCLEVPPFRFPIMSTSLDFPSHWL